MSKMEICKVPAKKAIRVTGVILITKESNVNKTRSLEMSL